MRTHIASLVLGSVLAVSIPAAAETPAAHEAAAPEDKALDDKAPVGDSDAKAASKGDAKDADSAAANPQTEEAQKVLVAYLDLVKKKKWDPAKKLVHPKTLALIADIKKRTGKEQHPMAPQFWAKDDFYLKDYKITGSTPHALGTIEFKLSCTNYRVQEKGESDGDEASYLVGKSGGKWLVVDRKDNGNFEDPSIKLDYKGYFDP